MKVIIDVPDNFFEIARGILLGAAISEEMENDVNEAMRKIYTAEEPLQVKMERLMTGDTEARQAYSQIMSAITTMALGEYAVMSNDDKKTTTSNLTARLESLQRQVEELKRKIQEEKT